MQQFCLSAEFYSRLKQQQVAAAHLLFRLERERCIC